MAEGQALVLDHIQPGGQPGTLSGGSQHTSSPGVTEASQAAQSTEPTFWNGDPTKLSPELQETYRNMQREFSAKTLELASQRKEWEKTQSDLAQAQAQLQAFQEQARNWEAWVPVLNRLREPSVMEKIAPYLYGEGTPQTQGAQPAATPATSPTQPAFSADDDEVATVALVKKIIDDYNGRNFMPQVQKMYREDIARTLQEAQKWIENYLGLHDSARQLELEELYGITPKEGAKFNLRDVLQYAVNNDIRDLRKAKQLLYYNDAMQQAQQVNAQQMQEAIAKAVKEAEDRVRAEMRQQALSHNTSLIPGGTAPQVEIGKAPNSYKSVEQGVMQRFLEKGYRP
jgi:hypothetical protein